MHTWRQLLNDYLEAIPSDFRISEQLQRVAAHRRIVFPQQAYSLEATTIRRENCCKLNFEDCSKCADARKKYMKT